MRRQEWNELRHMHTAEALYGRVYAQGLLTRAVALLSRRRGLAWLDDVVGGRQIVRRNEGLRGVALDAVRGSVRRSARYDQAFRPLSITSKQAWQRLARAMLNNQPVPPVALIRVGDDYFVRDGHLRVSVARALGATQIDALVEAWEATPCDGEQHSYLTTYMSGPQAAPGLNKGQSASSC
jgi:hypothetical protein